MTIKISFQKMNLQYFVDIFKQELAIYIFDMLHMFNNGVEYYFTIFQIISS